MDPASAIELVASIVQLTDATIKAVDYICGIRNATEESKRLAMELEQAKELFSRLHAKAENPQELTSAISWLAKDDGPLQHFKRALQVVQKQVDLGNGLKKIGSKFIWPHTKKKISLFLDELERIKSLVTLAMTENNIALSEDVIAQLRAVKEDTNNLEDQTAHIEALLQLNESICNDVQDLNRKLAEAASLDRAKECRIICTWLSSTDYAEHQISELRKWHQGTGSWFFSTAVFKEFITTRSSSLLCPGVPGAGKTVLSAVTVQYLRKRFREPRPTEDSPAVAFIFFDCKREGKQHIDHILSVLLKQMIQELDTVPENIRNLYALHSRRGSRPSLRQLMTALQTVLLSYSKTYFILDALDESPKDVRHELLDCIRELQGQANLCFMATTQINPQVMQQFPSSTPRITINGTDEDIRLFVKHKVMSLGNSFDEMQAEIVGKVTTAARGMFLLAEIHVGLLLREAHNVKQMKLALSSLESEPQTLEKAYKKAISRILQQSRQLIKLVWLTFAWLICYSRHLSAVRLQEFLAIDAQTGTIDEDAKTDIDTIVCASAGLLTLASGKAGCEAVTFVHYTAQKFIEQLIDTLFPDFYQKPLGLCGRYLRSILDKDQPEDFIDVLTNPRTPLVPHAYLTLSRAYEAQQNFRRPRPFDGDQVVFTFVRYFGFCEPAPLDKCFYILSKGINIQPQLHSINIPKDYLQDGEDSGDRWSRSTGNIHDRPTEFPQIRKLTELSGGEAVLKPDTEGTSSNGQRRLRQTDEGKLILNYVNVFTVASRVAQETRNLRASTCWTFTPSKVYVVT